LMFDLVTDADEEKQILLNQWFDRGVLAFQALLKTPEPDGAARGRSVFSTARKYGELPIVDLLLAIVSMQEVCPCNDRRYYEQL